MSEPGTPGTRDPQRAGHVFLIGFMGAGKSTIGRLLAEHLSLPFIDLDMLIEHHSGSSVVQIFAEQGEDAFRAIESDTLASLSDYPPTVVAPGGGVVLLPQNRRLLKTLGKVVYLKVTAGEALARIGQVEGRPLLSNGGPATAATLLEAREGLYRAVADHTVDTQGRLPEEIADEVAAALAEQRSPS